MYVYLYIYIYINIHIYTYTCIYIHVSGPVGAFVTLLVFQNVVTQVLPGTPIYIDCSTARRSTGNAFNRN